MAAEGTAASAVEPWGAAAGAEELAGLQCGTASPHIRWRGARSQVVGQRGRRAVGAAAVLMGR